MQLLPGQRDDVLAVNWLTPRLQVRGRGRVKVTVFLLRSVQPTKQERHQRALADSATKLQRHRVR